MGFVMHKYENCASIAYIYNLFIYYTNTSTSKNDVLKSFKTPILYLC